MAVAMVDNSHECLNPQPEAQTFSMDACIGPGGGVCAVNAWLVFKQRGLYICLLYIIPIFCSPESVLCLVPLAQTGRPLLAGGVGSYNHDCIGEEVEWRPMLTL